MSIGLRVSFTCGIILVMIMHGTNSLLMVVRVRRVRVTKRVLEQLDHFVANKRATALVYDAFFKIKGIKFRNENPDTKANYWLMCVELENQKERDLFLAETNAAKVMTRPIWQLMYRLPMYQHCQRDEQLNAQFLEERIVNIPSSVR